MQESLIQVINRTVFLKQPLKPSGLVFLRPDGVQLEFCQVEGHLYQYHNLGGKSIPNIGEIQIICIPSFCSF